MGIYNPRQRCDPLDLTNIPADRLSAEKAAQVGRVRREIARPGLCRQPSVGARPASAAGSPLEGSPPSCRPSPARSSSALTTGRAKARHRRARIQVTLLAEVIDPTASRQRNLEKVGAPV